MPELDPEPIPHIVLHPGDTIAIDARTDDGERLTVRLIDRHLKHYATLDCHLYDRGWRLHAIHFVAAGGGREAVRTQPEPYPYSEAHPQSNDDPNLYLGGVNVAPTHPDARPHNLILSNFGRVTAVPSDTDTSGDLTESGAAPLSALTSTHSHPHTHPRAGITDPNAHTHEHTHTHTGAVALSHGKPNYAYDHQHDEP